MKKITTLLLSLVLCLTSLMVIGCNNPNNEGEKSLSFYAPDGAPALAIAKLINDKDSLRTGKTVEYKVVDAGQISLILADGKEDIVIAPVNVASMLYKKANAKNHYVMVAVLTHGNFYIMSTEQMTVDNLVGIQVAVPNKGAVPDWTFKMALEKHGLSYTEETESDKVNIKYYKSGENVVSAIIDGEETIGLVPEPAASALEKRMKAQNRNIYRLDLQELYDNHDKSYPQAVLMVKKNLLEENSDLVATMQIKITESANWIKSNVSVAVSAVNEAGGISLKAPALSESAINGCNIYWQSAENAKSSVKNYINKITAIDSEKASAVNDDFFYIVG